MSKPKCFDRFNDCSHYTLWYSGWRRRKRRRRSRRWWQRWWGFKSKTTGQSETHVHKESDRKGSIYKSYSTYRILTYPYLLSTSYELMNLILKCKNVKSIFCPISISRGYLDQLKNICIMHTCKTQAFLKIRAEWSHFLCDHLDPELQPLQRAVQLTCEHFISFHRGEGQQTAAKHISWTTDLSDYDAFLPELHPQRTMRTLLESHERRI